MKVCIVSCMFFVNGYIFQCIPLPNLRQVGWILSVPRYNPEVIAKPSNNEGSLFMVFTNLDLRFFELETILLNCEVHSRLIFLV
jgi:hypothetical protein